MCGKGGGSTTTTYQPPQAVIDAYNDLLSRGRGLIESAQAPNYTPAQASQYAANVPGMVAGMSPNQTSAIQNISNMQGYINPFVNAGTAATLANINPLASQQFSSQAVNQYMSPYLTNVLGSALANINQTNAQQQQQVLGNAIQRGAFGGDRARIAQAELARQQNLSNNATIASLLNQGYGQALGEFNIQQQNAMTNAQIGQAGAQQLANMGLLGQQANLQQAQAQYGGGAQEQAQRQAELSTAYQQYLNQYQFPYQNLGFYGGLASGAASGMGGTTTGTPGAPSGLASALGIGSMLGSLPGTTAAGAATGGSGILGGLSWIGSLFSDKRVKENVKPIGKTYDGQTIYKYNYKGNPTTNLGLIAQEVEHHHPDAVSEMDGVKMVNYEKATKRAADRGHFASGGLIPKHYGLPTREDMQNMAESSFGSGFGDLDPSSQALASVDLIPYKSGGVVGHYVSGGVIGGQQNDDNEFDDIIKQTLPRLKQIESGGKNIQNPRSSAAGPYQFTHGTWQNLIEQNPNLGLTPEGRLDPRQQEIAAPIYTRGNAKALASQNIPVTPETLNMAHFLGAGGGAAFMKNYSQDPNQVAANVVNPEVLRANPEVFYNKDGTPRTLAEVYNIRTGSLAPPPKEGKEGAKGGKGGKPPVSQSLLGQMFPGLEDPAGLAMFRFGATLAGTPAPFGVGLAAAANAYADSLMQSKRLTSETELKAAQAEQAKSEALKGTLIKYGAGEAMLRPDPESETGFSITPLPIDLEPNRTTPIGTGPGPQAQAGVDVKTPSSAAPGALQPSSYGPQTANIDTSAVLQSFADMDRKEMYQPFRAETGKILYQQKVDAANKEAELAYNAKNDLATLVDAEARLATSEMTGGGALAQERQNFVNQLNTLLGIASDDPNYLTADQLENITSGQLFDKVARMAVVGKRVGQEAAQSLRETQRAFPNIEQTPQARAAILASLLVANQRDIDRANFYADYGRASKGMGNYLEKAFQQSHPSSLYDNEKKALAKIFLGTRDRQNLITRLLEHQNEPEAIKQFNEIMAKNSNGVMNMSRYFIQ